MRKARVIIGMGFRPVCNRQRATKRVKNANVTFHCSVFLYYTQLPPSMMTAGYFFAKCTYAHISARTTMIKRTKAKNGNKKSGRLSFSPNMRISKKKPFAHTYSIVMHILYYNDQILQPLAIFISLMFYRPDEQVRMGGGGRGSRTPQQKKIKIWKLKKKLFDP